ncbi:MAG: C39 family peptidase [Erysipelotrichaceae bacterium]|nr:C39 family peptidase [Erysipelotrichaceae bacterium]
MSNTMLKVLTSIALILTSNLTDLVSSNLNEANSSAQATTETSATAQDHSEASSSTHDLNETSTSNLASDCPILEKINIQLVQSVQEKGYFCVPACLQMVLDHHGIHVSQEQLAKEMNTSQVTGTEYVDLARVANKYIFDQETAEPAGAGYRVQTLERNVNNSEIYKTFESRVKTDISTGDPVFAAIDNRILYPELASANHMVLVTGYSVYAGTDNIAYYYIMDPSYLVQDPVYGGVKTVTAEELMDAITSNVEPAYIW